MLSVYLTMEAVFLGYCYVQVASYWNKKLNEAHARKENARHQVYVDFANEREKEMKSRVPNTKRFRGSESWGKWVAPLIIATFLAFPGISHATDCSKLLEPKQTQCYENLALRAHANEVKSAGNYELKVRKLILKFHLGTSQEDIYGFNNALNALDIVTPDLTTEQKQALKFVAGLTEAPVANPFDICISIVQSSGSVTLTCPGTHDRVQLDRGWLNAINGATVTFHINP